MVQAGNAEGVEQASAPASDSLTFRAIWEVANRVYESYFPTGPAILSDRTAGNPAGS